MLYINVHISATGLIGFSGYVGSIEPGVWKVQPQIDLDDLETDLDWEDKVMEVFEPELTFVPEKSFDRFLPCQIAT